MSCFVQLMTRTWFQLSITKLSLSLSFTLLESRICLMQKKLKTTLNRSCNSLSDIVHPSTPPLQLLIRKTCYHDVPKQSSQDLLYKQLSLTKPSFEHGNPIESFKLKRQEKPNLHVYYQAKTKNISNLALQSTYRSQIGLIPSPSNARR